MITQAMMLGDAIFFIVCILITLLHENNKDMGTLAKWMGLTVLLCSVAITTEHLLYSII